MIYIPELENIIKDRYNNTKNVTIVGETRVPYICTHCQEEQLKGTVKVTIETKKLDSTVEHQLATGTYCISCVENLLELPSSVVTKGMLDNIITDASKGVKNSKASIKKQVQQMNLDKEEEKTFLKTVTNKVEPIHRGLKSILQVTRKTTCTICKENTPMGYPMFEQKRYSFQKRKTFGYKVCINCMQEAIKAAEMSNQSILDNLKNTY